MGGTDAVPRGEFDDHFEPRDRMDGAGRWGRLAILGLGCRAGGGSDRSGRSMPDLGPSFEPFAQGVKRPVKAGA